MTYLSSFIRWETIIAAVSLAPRPRENQTAPAALPRLPLRRGIFPLALLVLLLALACTPNLGGENLGWSPLAVHFPPTPGEPARVYAAGPLDRNLNDLAERLGGINLAGDENRVKLRALEDFGSGTPRVAWTFPPLGSGQGLGGVFGPPAVSPELGLVFVGGVNGRLYALYTDNAAAGAGTPAWERTLRADPSRQPLPLVGGPVLAEVSRADPDNPGGGPTPIVIIGSEDGNLYGYRAADGAELDWSPFAAGDKIWSTPAVHNGIAYFGSQDRKVYAFDLREGRQLWQYETGGAVMGKPLVANGLVLIGSFDKNLYALDADDGELEWTFASGSWFWSGPVTDGETLFAPSMDGNLYALDFAAPEPGAVKEARWQHNMESPLVSRPALVPLGLAIASKDGRMRLLSVKPANLESGEVISNLPSLEGAEIKAPLAAGAPAAASLGDNLGNLAVIARHSVFVSGDNGIVQRIAVTEGQDKEALWCFDIRKHQPCS